MFYPLAGREYTFIYLSTATTEDRESTTDTESTAYSRYVCTTSREDSESIADIVNAADTEYTDDKAKSAGTANTDCRYRKYNE